MINEEKYGFLFQDEDSDPEIARIKSMLDDMGVNLDELDSEMQNYNPKKPLGYEVISEDAVEPNYNYPTDSGFDLYSTVDIVIPAFNRGLIPTGLKFDIPDGTELQIRPKSGLALNHGLTVLNTPGTADCGYTGEIKVIIFNTNPTEFRIEKGMKIAQAVLCPVINGKWVDLTKMDSIEDKDRGDKGFGSTGIFK